jgi:subtilisin family serine protease
MFEAESKDSKGGDASVKTGALSLSTATDALPQSLSSVLSRYGASELVRPLPNFERTDTLRTARDGRAIYAPDYTRLYRITLPSAADVDSVVAKLNRLPFVRYAEANQIVHPRWSPVDAAPGYAERSEGLLAVTPNDPRFGEQYALDNPSGPDIDAKRAWDITTGSSSVTLGIVDTGVDFFSHPDLSGRFTGSTPVAGNPHGTRVGGIIGARTNNAVGIAGVDWSARVHSDLFGDAAATAGAITRTVAQGAQVINNSWGLSGRSQLLTDALFDAYRSNVLLVHANPYESGLPGQTSDYPNDIAPWILNVGAVDQFGFAWDNTGVKAYTDVAAPGVQILTTNLGGGYTSLYSGTSFSAPHVTGVAGLLLAAAPSLKNYDLEQIIKRTAAHQDGTSGYNPETGYGMVNAYEAVRMVAPPNVVVHGPAQLTRVASGATRTFLTSPAPGLAAGRYYNVEVWELEADESFAFTSTPQVWLSNGEPGLSAAHPNSGQRWIQESVSSTSYNASTFFYFIKYNLLAQRIDRWVPFDPTIYKRDGSYKFTAIGEPAPYSPLTALIDGRTHLGWNEVSTYRADHTGGTGPVSYRWYTRTPGTPFWTDTGSQSRHYDLVMRYASGVELRVRVTRGNETVYAYHTVQYLGVEPPPDCGGAIICLQSMQKLKMQPLPTEFDLSSSPNPVQDRATVRYDLPEAGYVHIEVFDMLGRRVRTLVNESVSAGRFTSELDVVGLPSGMYLARMSVQTAEGSQQFTHRLMVAR